MNVDIFRYDKPNPEAKVRATRLVVKCYELS